MSDTVVEAAKYTQLTASAMVAAGPIKLLGIFVSAASATPTIKVWDATSAFGNVAVDTFTPVAGTFYPMPFVLPNGCFITISGTVSCTVSTDAA